MNIEDYILVKETDSELFQKQIRELIDKGYQLHGETNIITIDKNNNLIYTQPMVKYHDLNA